MSVHVQDHGIKFRKNRDSLRVLLAEIRPAPDQTVSAWSLIVAVTPPPSSNQAW